MKKINSKLWLKAIGVLFFGFAGLGALSNFGKFDLANKICTIVFIALAIFLARSWLKEWQSIQKNKKDLNEKAKNEITTIISAIDSGTLSPIVPEKVLLNTGESAYAEVDAVLEITKNKAIGSTGSGSSVSVRVTKGVYVRSGSSGSRKIYKNVTETYTGILAITNQRIVFVQSEKGFEIPLSKLSSISSADNQLFLQNSSKSYIIDVYAAEIFEKLIRKLREGIH